jgi:hypothetical protein
MKLRSIVTTFFMGSAVWLGGTVGASASSHREAPLITEMPKVDATDFYIFKSYETGRGDFVTVVANYLPLQDAYGGPNYFTLDPNALYEIHIDNNGDAVEDITFQFRFKNTLSNDGQGIALPIGPSGSTKNVPVPLAVVGPITASDRELLNVNETYTVTHVQGTRRAGTRAAVTHATTSSETFRKPLDNVGKATIAEYEAYASAHIYPIKIPGCDTNGKVFVGQRKDPFAVNLGQIFDLVNLANPLGAADQGLDTLAQKNVTSIVLELPIACITATGQTTVGAWTSASVRQARILNPNPTYTKSSVTGGAWVQVSRLGMPLVNEVVIGLPDKDKFNSSHPSKDGQFADYVTNPVLPAYLELLFGAAGVRAPTVFPRADLVAAFLTGVDSVNKNGSTAEMIRLNTALPATPKAMQNYLGAAACFVNGALTLSNPGCDPAGFPNGRRPGDDVVDIELRVAMGYLFGTDTQAPSRALPFTDGAKVDASKFGDTFPYLASPVPGSDRPDTRQ